MFARFLRSLILTVVSVAFIASAATACAATDDITDDFPTADTASVVQYTQGHIASQMTDHFNDLNWGAIMSEVNPIELDAINAESRLATMTVVISVTVKYLNTIPSSQPIAASVDDAVYFVGAAVRSFVDEYDISVSDADIAAMHAVVVRAFSPADDINTMITEAFDMGFAS